MNKATRFIKTAAIYFIGNILSRMIGIFLLPLYTKSFTPREFGNYDLIISLVSFFVPVIFFQIWDGMFRYGFEKNDVRGKYDLISNSLFIFTISIFFYSIIYLTILFLFKEDFSLYIYSYGIFFALQYQYSFIARVFMDNKLFVFSGVLNTFVTAISNIVMILLLGMNEESLYLSVIIGTLVQISLIEFKIKPLKNFAVKSINIVDIKNMIRFSIPLCIATISYWLLSGFTKICIAQQLGVFENGLYAVANKFAVLISLVIGIFQFAWNETAYLISNDNNRIEKYQLSIDYILKVIVIGSSISILVIKLIFPYFIDKQYSEALHIIPLTLIGVSVNSLAGFVGTIFMTEKRTKHILWTTIVSSLVNILTTSMFIKSWGLQGAIGALCLSFVILAIVRLLLIKYIFKLSLPTSNFGYILILIITVFIFS